MPYHAPMRSILVGGYLLLAVACQCGPPNDSDGGFDGFDGGFDAGSGDAAVACADLAWAAPPGCTATDLE